MKPLGYEATIGRVLFGRMSEEEGSDRCLQRMMVERQIFCPIAKTILDIRTAVLYTGGIGNHDLCLSPAGWNKMFKQYGVKGYAEFITKAGGRFFNAPKEREHRKPKVSQDETLPGFEEVTPCKD